MFCDDCPFCCKSNADWDVLLETPHFVVKPALGQIVEGYLLICSKEHIISFGQLSSSLFEELSLVKLEVKRVLNDFYTTPLFFEHGTVSLEKRGGSCIDHAHLHAVPVDVDIYEDILTELIGYAVTDFQKVRVLFDEKKPYIYYEKQDGSSFIFELESPVPRQYLRRIIASKINRLERWDWRTCPGYQEYFRTVDRLRDAFRVSSLMKEESL